MTLTETRRYPPDNSVGLNPVGLKSIELVKRFRTFKRLKTVKSWLCLGLFVCQPAAAEDLVQYSTIGALLAGEYDGDMSVARLTRMGNFGLGAVNGLAGEMMALDGAFYVADAQGKTTRLEADSRMPFAIVTRWQPQQTRSVQNVKNSDYAALQQACAGLADNPNVPAALRIDGLFSELLLRSERPQQKPYAPLAQVMKTDEVRFRADDVRGTLIGFYTPGYLSGVSVPGYHFHFIAEDLRLGGHVLDAQLAQGNISVQLLTGFRVEFPDNSRFARLNLFEDHAQALRRVEGLEGLPE